jgi:Sugar phosphate isomerases/epimerases
MKFSVSSYSFFSLISSGQMTSLDCIKKAKEMGFDAIEFVDFVDMNPKDGSSREEYAKKLRAECEKESLEISNYTVGADFLNAFDGDTKAEIERVKGEIDIAMILGAKSVRHDATVGYPYNGGSFKSFDSVLPILADACREVTVYAQEKGIRTMVENHGFFAQDSERVEKLVSTVNHENFGLLCDIGNFICADEPSEKAVGRVAPYAFYAHAKDFLLKDGSAGNPGKGFFQTRSGNFARGTIIGHGVIPVRKCISILKAAGYDGAIAIEFEGLENPLTAIEIGLENLKNFCK